jgi:hypothetical protein
MKDKQSLHLKVQELCDCFATTDPLKEMSLLKKDIDKHEAALKWLALAVLHGINAGAKKITFFNSKKGAATVTAEYREAVLPDPGTETGAKIIEVMRDITHLEGDEVETPFAVGVRDGSIEMRIKLKRNVDGESVTLNFME